MSLLCEENNLEDLLLLKISILLNETCIILILKIKISEKNKKIKYKFYLRIIFFCENFFLLVSK